MNKKNLTTTALILGTLVFFSHANAYTSCVGGTEITANRYGTDAQGNSLDKGGYCSSDGSDCNGKTFCRSDNTMNYWSAFTWCESNGGKLADLTTLCPGVPASTNKTNGACPNMAGVTGPSNNYALRTNKSAAPVSTFSCVVTKDGQIDCGCCGYGYKSIPIYAICE